MRSCIFWKTASTKQKTKKWWIWIDNKANCSVNERWISPTWKQLFHYYHYSTVSFNSTCKISLIICLLHFCNCWIRGTLKSKSNNKKTLWADVRLIKEKSIIDNNVKVGCMNLTKIVSKYYLDCRYVNVKAHKANHVPHPIISQIQTPFTFLRPTNTTIFSKYYVNFTKVFVVIISTLITLIRP